MWQGRESNPLAPQAKSLTTRPPLLQLSQEVIKCENNNDQGLNIDTITCLQSTSQYKKNIDRFKFLP